MAEAAPHPGRVQAHAAAGVLGRAVAQAGAEQRCHGRQGARAHGGLQALARRALLPSVLVPTMR